MSYLIRANTPSAALGLVSTNVDTELDELVRKSVIDFEIAEQQKGRKITEPEKKQVYDFNSVFLQKLMGSIDVRIQVLEDDAKEYRKQIYTLLASKYDILVQLRQNERRLSELQKQEFNLFLELSESVSRMAYKFVKSSVAIVCGVVKDLITGELDLDLSAIADRLSEDFSQASMEIMAEGLNTLLVIAFQAVDAKGGIAGRALVSLAASINEIVKNVCSGKVAAIVETTKEWSKAALAQPGTELRRLARQEALRYADLTEKHVADYNKISDSSNVKGFFKQSKEAIRKSQDIPNELEQAFNKTLESTGKAVAKEGLAVAGQAFPAVKAGAAIAVGVANIYASFCETIKDVPMLKQLDKAATEAKSKNKANDARNQAEIDRLQEQIDAQAKQYEQTNDAIITSLNNHTATSMNIVQYSFSAAWLIKSCLQISALSEVYPYMSRDELITLYWSRIGTDLFLGISRLVNLNMLSLVMRGFMEYIDVELNHKKLSCPLIDGDLEQQLKMKWGLDRTTYCKFMSSIEVRSFVEQYQASKEASTPTQASRDIDLDSFVSSYRSKIKEKARLFNQRYFASQNLFQSYAIAGRPLNMSSLDPMVQGYYNVDLDAVNDDTNNTVANAGQQIVLSDKISQSSASSSKRLIAVGLLSALGIAVFVIQQKAKKRKARYKGF
jgi:hypothetical protein